MPNVIDGTNIDTTQISYSKIKLNPAGGQVINLLNKFVGSNDGKKYKEDGIVLKTPLMFTWGAQEVLDQSKNKTGKFTMSLQFPEEKYSNDYPQAKLFLESIQKLEAKIKADALTNSSEWFGKAIKNAETIEDKFNPILKYGKKTGSAPCLTVKIPRSQEGGWKTEIYDENRNPLFLNGENYAHLTPIEFLKPRIDVMCVIQCSGVWIVGGRVSITWNLKQCVIKNPKISLFVEGVCLLNPTVDEINQLKSQQEHEQDSESSENNIATTSISATIVDDSDEEDEELPIPIGFEPVTEKTEKVEDLKKKSVAKKTIVKSK
jgi:hypothetical protein